MYCPLNPAVMPLLHRWIAEYLELFGPIRDFHIGADEARELGACPACKAFAAEHSTSRLFIDHINAVAAPLLQKGIRPLIWADMIIRHPEALERLDRRIALVDWLYDRYAACGTAQFFSGGAKTRDTIPEPLLARFRPYLFPQGEEPGRALDPFYSGAFLADAGFTVITAPGSSSSGDSVFSSRTWLHVLNSFDSARTAVRAGRPDLIQTSWSIRLNPYDVQMPAIAAVPFAATHPGATVEDFQRTFEQDRFGGECPAFWPAAAPLSLPCLFASTHTLGFNHPPDQVPADQVKRVLTGLSDRQELNAQTRLTRKRLQDYREAAFRLAALRRQVKKGGDWLAVFEAAAGHLETRAEIALLFLDEVGAVLADQPLTGARQPEAARLLARHRARRKQYAAFLADRLKPERIPQYLDWGFDTVTRPLARLAGA